MLSRLGTVTAFEPDTAARAMAAKQAQRLHGRATVLAGSCPDGVPDAGPFDLICLFDVLEHISEDVATLDALRRRLRSDGVIVLTVPAYPRLWGPHDRFLHHKRRYTRAALRNAAAAARLRVRTLTSFNMILLPALVCVRLLEACLPVDSSVGRTRPPQWVNRALHSVLSTELLLLRHVRLPAGLSLLAVLEPDGPAPAQRAEQIRAEPMCMSSPLRSDRTGQVW